MVVPGQWKPVQQLASEEVGVKMVAGWSLTISTLIIFETGLSFRQTYQAAWAVGSHGSASSKEEASSRLGTPEDHCVVLSRSQRALTGAQGPSGASELPPRRPRVAPTGGRISPLTPEH